MCLEIEEMIVRKLNCAKIALLFTISIVGYSYFFVLKMQENNILKANSIDKRYDLNACFTDLYD